MVFRANAAVFNTRISSALSSTAALTYFVTNVLKSLERIQRRCVIVERLFSNSFSFVFFLVPGRFFHEMCEEKATSNRPRRRDC